VGDVSERLTAEVGGFVAGMHEAGSAAREAASDVKKLRDAAAEVGAGAGGLTALDAQLDEVRNKAAEASAALAAMKHETRSAGGGGLGGGLGSMAGLDSFRAKLGEITGLMGALDAEATGMDLAQGFSAAEGVIGDVAGGIQDVESGLNDAETAMGGLEQAVNSGITSLGSGFASLGQSAVQMAPMVAMWGTIGVLAAGAVPVVASLGAGVAAFGALAAPAVMRVKDAYQQVSAAAKTYHQAEAVYKQDPTKANAAAVHRDLVKMKAAYASVPSDLRPAVRSIHQLGAAWSELAKKSGIQGDVLKMMPKAVNDIKDLFPAVSKLGQAFSPIMSRMLGDLGKFEKSSGFNKFISNLGKDMGPAYTAIKKLGGAVGGLLSDLVKPGVMKSAGEMFGSIATAINKISPSAIKALQIGMKIVGGTASLFGEMFNPDKSPIGAGKGKVQVSPAMARFGLGAPQTAALVAAANNQARAVLNAQRRALGLPALTITPKIKVAKPKDLPLSKIFPKGPGGNFTLRPKLTVDPQVKVNKPKDLSFDKIFGKGASGVGITTKTQHVKVDAPGAGAAKSQLEGVHAAQQKISSTKSNVHVNLTGLAGAKSQLDGLRAKLGGHWPNPKIQVQLTGAQQASSSLQRLGTTATTMSSAVSAGAGRAMSSVQQMSSGMRGAIAPLPGEFRAIGQAAAAGLAGGIRAGTGAAVAAAASMAAQVEAAARVHLQTHSPSRKFQKIGADVIAGFILGVQGGKSQVQAAMHAVFGTPFTDSAITSAINKLKQDVQDAYNRKLAGSVTRDKLEKELAKAKKGTAEYKRLEKELHGKTEFKPISKSQETALTRLLDRDNKKLMALAKQRQTLENQIKAADELSASVKSAAISGADITGIAGNTQQGLIQADQAQGAKGTAQNPYQNIQEGLSDQLSKIRQFRRDIVKLKKEGLDRTSIKQLLQAGVTGGGLSTAEQLLGEGKGGVKKVAELQKEIGKAAGQLGVAGANAAYESGSQIGRGLAAGLKDSLKDVNKAMSNIAKSLVTSLMTALGASSKDIRKALKKLDKELGLDDGSGGGGHKVKPPHIRAPDPGHRMHPGPVHRKPPHVMHPDSMTMLPPGGYAGHGGGTDVIVINLTSELKLDGKTHARTVQTHTLRRARRNTRSGMTLPLRGT
jgi:hypothetical protein